VTVASPIRVAQLERRSFPGHYSMERVFADVRAHLPKWVSAELWVTQDYNKGLLPRLHTVIEARHHQSDLTHVTGDINYAALLLDRRRSVLTVHDTEFLERASRAKAILYTWLWLKLPVRRVALVTVPSEATRDDVVRLTRVDPAKIKVIPNPVADEFVPLPPRSPSGTPVVLVMGTRPNKNLKRMVQALEGLGCRALIVGEPDGDQRVALERSGVEFEVRSALADEEVREVYAECDLLLFASTKEGFGIPVLEAQASGRPVVTSDRPPMTVVSGGAACLVDPFDVVSIRAGVERVLASDTYRSELVERGLENVRRYRAADVALQYAGLYAELASRR
jgi:glycosyltransferase involved in cell wall biosynthesis